MRSNGFEPPDLQGVFLNSRPYIEVFSFWQRLFVRNTACLLDRRETECCQFCRQLLPDPGRSGRVREEHGAQGDGTRPGGKELECVASADNTTHSHNRHAYCFEAGMDG